MLTPAQLLGWAGAHPDLTALDDLRVDWVHGRVHKIGGCPLRNGETVATLDVDDPACADDDELILPCPCGGPAVLRTFAVAIGHLTLELAGQQRGKDTGSPARRPFTLLHAAQEMLHPDTDEHPVRLYSVDWATEAAVTPASAQATELLRLRPALRESLPAAVATHLQRTDLATVLDLEHLLAGASLPASPGGGGTGRGGRKDGDPGTGEVYLACLERYAVGGWSDHLLLTAPVLEADAGGPSAVVHRVGGRAAAILRADADPDGRLGPVLGDDQLQLLGDVDPGYDQPQLLAATAALWQGALRGTPLADLRTAYRTGLQLLDPR